MIYLEKLAAIRQQMKADGVDAYIVPSADPHISEYLPDHFKAISFLTGFTGSVSTVVITQNFAGLWADSRYFEQATAQLQNTGYELVKLKAAHTPEYITYLKELLPPNAQVAFDERTISVALGQQLEKSFAKTEVIFVNKDYVGQIWHDRPALPIAKAYILDEKYTGKSTGQKLADVRQAMAKADANYHLISSLDDLAWLFNLRGNDISYNPVVLSFALINGSHATLYIDSGKLSADDLTHLSQNDINIASYNAIEQDLQHLPSNAKVLIDPRRNCFALYKQLPQTVQVILDTNPSTSLKAIKNQTEIASMRQTMLKDGLAMVKFIKWLKEQLGNKKITELSAQAKLEEFRAQQQGFSGLSFGTIAAYKAHGALPHYSSTPQSDVEIEANGLFLLDSGGQYHYGTTDITRVFPLGNNTEQEAIDYTLVLKAMIAGSRLKFPKGTCGYQIDAVVRQPIWEQGINYGHGTGHGIGFFLNVHEGPHSFSPAAIATTVDPGTITSIEPGIYRPGKHGVRIENLVLTVLAETTEFGDFYSFETLTLCPIDTSIIKKDLLGATEIAWLNAYHARVFDLLSPHLEQNEMLFLKEATKAI